MKTCLIILSLLFAFIFDCKAQVRQTHSLDSLLKIMKDSGIATMAIGNLTTGTATNSGFDSASLRHWIDSIWKDDSDTVKVIMLVCDTTIEIRDTAYYNSLSKEWKDNYRLAVSMPWAYWQYGYSVREWNSIYVTYLDADKNKLPKNIIVWMAKEIEK